MPEEPRQIFGTWRQIAVVVDGKQVPGGDGLTLTVDENGYTVRLNKRVIQRGTSVSNYEVEPFQADSTATEGTNAGQTIRQIFRVEGDVLISCAANPGMDRPTEFSSATGGGHTLSIWLRTQPHPSGPLSSTSKLWIGGAVVIAMLVAAAKGDLTRNFGHGAEVVTSGTVTALFLAAILMTFRSPPAVAFFVGLAGAVALTVYSELRPLLGDALGVPLAQLVCLATAFATLTIFWIASVWLFPKKMPG